VSKAVIEVLFQVPVVVWTSRPPLTVSRDRNTRIMQSMIPDTKEYKPVNSATVTCAQMKTESLLAQCCSCMQKSIH